MRLAMLEARIFGIGEKGGRRNDGADGILSFKNVFYIGDDLGRVCFYALQWSLSLLLADIARWNLVDLIHRETRPGLTKGQNVNLDKSCHRNWIS